MPCRYVQYQPGDQKWTETWCSISLTKLFNLLTKIDHPTNAGTPDHPHPVYIDRSTVNPGILHCLVSGNNCRLGKRIHFTGLLLVQKVSCIKVLQFASKTS